MNLGICIDILWLPSISENAFDCVSYPTPLSLRLLFVGHLISPPSLVWQRQHSDQIISSEPKCMTRTKVRIPGNF